DDGGREERDADDVLAIGERQVLWIIDVRFEDRPGLVNNCVRVPPEQVPSQLAVGSARKSEGGRMQRKGIGQQTRESAETKRGEPGLAGGQSDSWTPNTRNH